MSETKDKTKKQNWDKNMGSNKIVIYSGKAVRGGEHSLNMFGIILNQVCV